MVDSRDAAFLNTSLPPDAPIRVMRTEHAGLGVYATRKIRPGETVLVEKPLVLTVSRSAESHVCARCLASISARPLRCEGCARCHYCSERCRAAHAHGKLECAARASDGDAADVGDLVDQAVALLAMRRDAGDVETLPGVRCDYASYRGRLDRIARTKATGEAIRRATKAALRAVPEAARVPPAELFDVLNRHQCNVYGVLGAGNADVALASFVGAFHLFNHSCCPNLVFDCVPREICDDGPPRFALVALTAIEEGAELCHCYAPSAAGPSVRRAYLRQHHGFECTCARCGCDDPADELDFEERLERARCPLPGCGTGLSYQLAGGRRRCVQCGGTWDDEGSSGEESDG